MADPCAMLLKKMGQILEHLVEDDDDGKAYIAVSSKCSSLIAMHLISILPSLETDGPPAEVGTPNVPNCASGSETDRRYMEIGMAAAER